MTKRGMPDLTAGAESSSAIPAGATGVDSFREEYARSLEAYVTGGGEAALRRAYEVGRGALGKGVGLLELTMLHESVLIDVLRQQKGREAEVTAAATQFLAESLSPYQMAYLGFFEANEALRGLNETLESEARRIARMLHDGAGQLLFALELALGDLARELPPSIAPRVTELLDLTHQVDQQLRCLSRELHPVILDDLGLMPALDLLAKRMSKQTGLVVAFKTSASERLPAAVESCLYRIVQEALTNVVRHAQATRATIEIDRRQNAIVCEVRDNGVGVAPGPRRLSRGGGLGLIGIRERLASLNGTLDVRTGAERGTKLVFTIPLPSSSAAITPSVSPLESADVH